MYTFQVHRDISTLMAEQLTEVVRARGERRSILSANDIGQMISWMGKVEAAIGLPDDVYCFFEVLRKVQEHYMQKAAPVQFVVAKEQSRAALTVSLYDFQALLSWLTEIRRTVTINEGTANLYGLFQMILQEGV